MHRRFADRMLSVFSPVRRYGCTNHLCAHEALLWKNSTLGQRPIAAAAGLAGAAVAGALVMGLGLYFASDDSTRAYVLDAHTSVVRPDAVKQDATLAMPDPRHLPELKCEPASALETKPDTGDLKVDFLIPVPALGPAAAEASASTSTEAGASVEAR